MTHLTLESLTPRQVVEELDRFVVGQHPAKRAVAIALRNRWRRQQLGDEMAEEIYPKNILMIGPTGVGKTEIARRLAKLSRAPFLKIEASKFTEVGYVGRDVEAMIRDLVEISVGLVKEERRQAVQHSAKDRTEDRILQLLFPTSDAEGGFQETRAKLREKLKSGDLEDREVEIEVDDSSGANFQMFTPQGVEQIGFDIKDLMPGLFGGKKKRRTVTVAEAREILLSQEAEKLIDSGQVAREACERVQESGIIFLDEMDKIAGREGGRGPDISREGVQRDLLPIVEGSTVATKYGPVKTDHVLFIAAGAFHVAKPSDLIPELQGRFPIRVELSALSEEDFVRILSEPQNALTKQYSALLSTEGLNLSFEEDAISEIARLAVEVNSTTENIGARRLATLLERLLEDVSFEAPDMDGLELKIDGAYVRANLADIVNDQDLSRYVL